MVAEPRKKPVAVALPLEAINKQIRILRFAEGKMVHSSSTIGMLGLLSQLRVLAQPAAA